MYGSDVTTASDHLISLGYLKPNQITRHTSGYVVFNDSMVRAINAYERDKGLIEDGEITKATAAELLKDVLEYRELGNRELTIGVVGTDVAEMKNLLIEKGYAPEPKLGRFDIIEFNLELFDCLDVFLRDVGLEWEGKVDTRIVQLLKNNNND